MAPSPYSGVSSKNMTKRLFYDPAETPLLKRILYLFRPAALPIGKFTLDILLETVSGCNARNGMTSRFNYIIVTVPDLTVTHKVEFLD